MRGITSLSLFLLIAACGSDNNNKPADAAKAADGPPDAAPETLGPPPDLAMPCTDAEADVYTLPASLPTMSDAHRGDVFRCAKTESLSKSKIDSQIVAYNAGGFGTTYVGTTTVPSVSGFWSFRIAYRSERNTVGTARAEGDMAAVLLVPEHPLANAPLVVFGHGSVGVAAKCAPTRLDLSGAVHDEDYPSMLYRLAGAGFTVIAPDYNGFSYNQPPGYFNAEDEAHSILDATRAAAKILPSPPAKVVFVGHSQGGHAVVAAQTYAKAYGMTGELVGVAALAPLWASLDLFAAGTTPTGGLMTATDDSAILYAMEYAYSAGELRDGTGHGVDVFATAKQVAAKDTMLGGECYDDVKLQALGTTPADFFDSTYINAVGNACSLGGTCTDQLSTKWKAIWQTDRPALDPTGAPLLILNGGADTFVIPGRANCAKKKFTADLSSGTPTTTVKYCYDDNAGHRDLVRDGLADYVVKWVASQAGAGADPGACTALPAVACPGLPMDY
ncbi:MAG: alpha/beta fold hydrolase [Deltaproteobacteria bacterium]